MQCACVRLSPTAFPALQHFSTLSHKRHDVSKNKKLFNTKCVYLFPLQTLSETFLILKIIERDMIINAYRSSCIVPVIVFRF